MSKPKTQDVYKRKTGFSSTPFSPTPLTEVADNKRVLMEYHHGIISFSTNEIRISVRNGYNCVEGKSLELLCISKEKVVISGQIECIRFYRGGE